MCGIFGVLYRDGVQMPDEGRLAATARLLRHRGPDSVGMHAEPGIGLVQSRLALVDLTDRARPPFVVDSVLSFSEARTDILSAFASFSPDMEKIARSFFDEGRIDAEVRQNKRSGAFSYPAALPGKPMILMSFHGTSAARKTLAHELGHGIQQTLAVEKGYLQQRAPLPLAETFSAFSEGLLYRHLIAQEKDPSRQRDLMAERMDIMLSTVGYQTAVYRFEKELFKDRGDEGAWDAEDIDHLWKKMQKECFGQSVDMDAEGAGSEWMYRHRIRRPFYSYPYSFGALLAEALLDIYDKTPDKKLFADKYQAFMKEAGSKPLAVLLADFGLDVEENAFWRKGLAKIERDLASLIKLDSQINTPAVPKTGGPTL